MTSEYYERRGPHWQPEGAALFVTWRLHGSLPKHPPMIKSAGKAFVAMDRELAKAPGGPRWLADPRLAQLVFECLKHGESAPRLYSLRAWVIMPNHVHILIRPNTGLPRITRSIKNYSARKANEILGRTGQPFWQDESYDHWVRNQSELEKVVRYIEVNPVSAGLAPKPETWRWSSAWAGQEACPTLR